MKTHVPARTVVYVRSSTLRLMTCLALASLVALGPGRALGQRPLGVDVYEGDGSVNWSSAKSSGRSFAWAKATEGNYYQDPNYAANLSNGKGAGLYMGAYHFARPDLNSPGTEASYFWSFASGHISKDGKTLMPVLDFETFNGVVGASSYSAWVNAWCDDVVSSGSGAGMKVRPVVYTSACSACNLDTSVAQWIPWIADYNGQDPQTGGPWSVCGSCAVWGGGVWDAWQYSSSVSVPGVPGDVNGQCDVDVFNGSSSDLVSTLVIGGGSGGGSTQFAAYVGPIQANSDGRLEMFGVGANTDIWHDYQNAPNSSWNGWIDMANGNSLAGPAVSHDKDGRLEVFVATGSGRVWHNYQVPGGGGAWNGWSNQGGPSVTNLVALTNLDGRIEVFGIGNDGYVWHEWQTSANGGWTTSWSSTGGQQIKAGMAGTINADGRLELFGQGNNGHVWHNYQTSPGQVFNGWVDMGASSAGLDSHLAVAQNADGRLEVFGVDSGGNVWHDWQATPGSGWNGWVGFGGQSGIKPGFIVGINLDGRLEMFGVGANGNLYHVWQDEPGTRWHAWADLGGNSDQHLMVANNANGALQLFAIGGGNAVYTIYQNTPGGSWGNWFTMGGAGTRFFYGQP